MTEQDALIEHLRDEERAAIREVDGGQDRAEAVALVEAASDAGAYLDHLRRHGPQTLGGDICLVHGLAEGACFRVTIPDSLAEPEADAMSETRTAVGAR